ncbi:MAG: hypothetical protein K2J87_04170 [Muribaculaceae bacterium]|nr:hypothetical protein [Muribaculaceae bacterium]
MKNIFAILAFLLCILVPAQARTETFRLKVGQFDKLAVYDNVHVVYHANPDSTGYVVYRADENLADIFLFSNVKGTLKIQLTSENVS